MTREPRIVRAGEIGVAPDGDIVISGWEINAAGRDFVERDDSGELRVAGFTLLDLVKASRVKDVLAGRALDG